MSADLVRPAAAIDQLSFLVQLWLMERLVRRIRERSEHAPDSCEREPEEMAYDPAIQREWRGIEAGFAMTDSDGLEAML